MLYRSGLDVKVALLGGAIMIGRRGGSLAGVATPNFVLRQVHTNRHAHPRLASQAPERRGLCAGAIGGAMIPAAARDSRGTIGTAFHSRFARSAT
jgi:hypothetical protein